MTSEEIEQILSIIPREDPNLLFHPVNADGFTVGYEVVYVDNPHPDIYEMASLLNFREKQLPEGYDFQRLSEVFLSERNIQLREYYRLKEIKEKRDYEY